MIVRIANWAFAALLALIGVYLAVRGATLISLGGSWYYLLAGLALLGVVALLVLRNAWGPRLYAAIVLATVVWAFFESGLDFVSLLPRLAAWIVVGLWFLSPWHAAAMRGDDRDRSAGGLWVGGASVLGVLLLTVAAMQPYHLVRSERAEVAEAAAAADWRHYGNSPGGTRFSELSQINVSNVGDLEEVWRYRTGIPYEFKNTPLQVGELLYVCTAGNTVIAIDARTGEERWRHVPNNTFVGSTPEELASGSYFSRTCRGVGYYEAAAGYDGPCPERILTGTTDARLLALNATTGAKCSDFGVDGEVDLNVGLGPRDPYGYMFTSVPLIAGDKAVVGGWVMDNQELGNVSGVLRAFNVVSGAFEWAWDMGDLGNQGMPAGEAGEFTRGTPNVWSIMSYDPELDLVFAPTGNASPDYFGGRRRPFDDDYSSSIIAIHGDSGELAWSYQTVHHDIWDYDIPSQPTLVDITVDGERVPVVLAPTKRGEIFVLDRRDGTPVYPAQTCPDGSPAQPGGECAVPQGTVEGDYVTATQPFSGLPNFRPDRFERDMWGVTPLDQLYCRIEYRKMRYEGHFTPPMRGGGGGASGEPTWGGSFQYPGNAGGFNWPSVSVDPDNGWLIAQPMLVGNRIVMATPAERAAIYGGPQAAPAVEESRDAEPGADAEEETIEELAERRRAEQAYTYLAQGEWDPDTARYGLTARFMSDWRLPLLGIPSGLPCFEPPYGRLAVIDLNTNTLLWSRPIGNMRELGPFGIKPGLPFEVGTPVLGGTTTTRGGLIFQLGTIDSTFRAVDVETGRIKWSEHLPNTASSTPVTYAVDGRQYVVVAVPQDPSVDPGDGQGGWVIAYALPEDE
ncbi:MAG: PQQ-binding-like beta-propeller repeat protein [Maricaulaceae bacterium]|jgi:membrane-bound PQQ-dependent dehydrogenase (glucose/quinate/shikimate family)